eukprot:824705_1
MSNSPLVVTTTTTQTNKILDLSSIIKTSAADKCVTSEMFHLDDFDVYFNVYPNGKKESKEGYCGIYTKITNVKQNDHRKISCVLQCGTQTHDIRGYATQFKKGWGSSNIFTIAQVRQHPVLHAVFKINHDPLFVDTEPAVTFAQQHETMHEISRTNGDVTLVVELLHDGQLGGEPSPKRRKIGNEIIVSSIVLRAASTVFNKMLTNNMREGTSKRI